MGEVKIRWIGQNGYILNDGKHEICIDPYLSNVVDRIAQRGRMVEAPILPEDLKSDAVICFTPSFNPTILSNSISLKWFAYMSNVGGSNLLVKILYTFSVLLSMKSFRYAFESNFCNFRGNFCNFVNQAFIV